MKLFDTPEETIRSSVACTWCGSDVGDRCIDHDRLGGTRLSPHTHAQRWRDYWNATHTPAEAIAVFANPKR